MEGSSAPQFDGKLSDAADATQVAATVDAKECYGFGNDSDAEEVEGLSFANFAPTSTASVEAAEAQRRISQTFEHDFDMFNARILTMMDEIAVDLKSGGDELSPRSHPRRTDASRRRSTLLPVLEDAEDEQQDGEYELLSAPAASQWQRSSPCFQHRSSAVQFEASAMSTLLSVQNQLLEMQMENAELKKKVAELDSELVAAKASQAVGGVGGGEKDPSSAEPVAASDVPAATSDAAVVSTPGAVAAASADGDPLAVDAVCAPAAFDPALNFAPADRQPPAVDCGKDAEQQSIVEKDAIIQLAQTLPVDGLCGNEASSRPARANSRRRKSTGDDEDPIGDVEHTKSSRVALRNQLEAQRLQLRAERAHRRTLEDENKELKVKLQKCEKVVKRLSKEIEELTKRIPSTISEESAAWRPNAARSSTADLDKAARISKNMDKWRAAVTQKEEKKDSVIANFNRAISGFFSGLAAQMEEPVEEIPPLTWLPDTTSRNVKISEDGRAASFCGPDKADLHSFVCIAESPQLEDGFGFEVRVTKVGRGNDDGLAIGFTSTPPVEWPRSLPETADMLPGGVWLVGYDGQFWSAAANREVGEWAKSKFHPSRLRVGDRVTVQVSFEGRFEVAVNEKLAWATNIQLEPDVLLYGVVDLLGNTDEVTLIDEVLVADD